MHNHPVTVSLLAAPDRRGGCCAGADANLNQENPNMSKIQFETILKIGLLICVFLLSGATTAMAQGASPLVISEFRFRGYFGSNDEFVELYNNSDSDIVVNAADGSSGWTVAEYGGYRLESSGNAVLPNGTVIKARSHVLVANYYQSTRSVVRLYDCCSFVAYGYFDGHQVGDDVGVAIFATNNQANFTDANKLDSVGFSTIGSGPYREGAGLPPIGSAPGEYAWIRRANGFQLQDTNDNLADFQFVSTTGGTWNGVQSILGGPAPENGFSARRGNQPGNATPAASLLDSNVAATIQPNELRDVQPVGNGTEGTLEIRRKITNTTGAAISQLRLRVTDITGYPAVPGMADLRVLSSIDKSVQLSNGTTVTVKGTRVDQPPTQFLGGGLNSSISVQLPGGSLANGASVNIRIVFGVMQVGNYRFATDIPLGDTEGTIVPAAANVSIFGKVGNTSDGPTIGFSGVTVTLSGSQSATTTTDANGNYAFNNLLAGGSYSISATKSGFTFTPVIQQIVNLSGNQEVDFNGGFNKPQPGDILISEFRNRGPNGANDEFIELYNNTDTDFTVSTDDESQGWTVVLNGGYNVIILPNGFVLKARQHFAGTEFYMFYSGIPGLVNNYLAPRDTDWGYFDGFGLPDDSGLGLFKTNDPAHFVNAYRLDAVGFSTMSNSLFKEGSGLAPLGATESEYSFVRRQIGFTAQDTNNNAADFVLVSTDGGVYNGSQSVLGAPGPETTSAPVRGNLPGVCGLTQSLLDTDAPANGGENFVNAGSTISIRRKITNGSSTKMTRLRFRVVDISTLGNRTPGEADLRIVNSPDTMATLTNGSTVTVKGTTLEDPPSQPDGGGLNSSLTVALPSGGLNPGASISVQFLLNVIQPGTLRLDIDTPDGPCDTTGPSTMATLNPPANGAGWNKTNVMVSLDAIDNANGSGIKDISYIMSGAQSTPLTVVNSSSVAIPITGEGQTIITFFARDNASNTESPHTLIVKLDKTSPVISNLPSPAVNAISPGGATVAWSGPSVSDNLDPNPSLNCSSVSGSTFPIGTTQVTCTAGDQAGNSSSASFDVTVSPPSHPPSNPIAYVTNPGELVEIDTTDDSILARVPVAGRPGPVAVTPDRTRVYMTNYGNNTVTVVSAVTNMVAAAVPIGNAPSGLAMSPDGSKVYVADDSTNDVWVVNTSTNAVSGRIPVGTSPADLAVSPDGNEVWVTNVDSNSVSVINTASNSVVATITDQMHHPTYVAITRNGRRAYVVNDLCCIRVVDTATRTVVNTIQVPDGPAGIFMSSDCTRAYLVHGGPGGPVSVIDTRSEQVVATLPIGAYPGKAATTPDGSRVYVTGTANGYVTVANSTNAIVNYIQVGPGGDGNGPFGVAISGQPEPCPNFDSTPPITSFLSSPQANAAGWNNSDVTISVSAVDESGGSGVENITYGATGAQVIPTTIVDGTTISFTISAEGETTVTYFARDNAGNVEVAHTVVIKLDKTAPILNVSRTPDANAAGWNKEDVTANYTASDALSGLDAASPSNGSFVFNSEGANQSHTFVVTDAAGNTTTATVGNVNIDKTAPTVDSQATAGGNPYSAGTWTNRPVSVSFNCSDTGSGVADVTQPITLSGEGANQSAAGVCTDVAGNTANTSFNQVKIDLTPPVIDVSRTPTANAAGWNNGNVTANYAANDSLSGLGTGSPASGSFTFTSEGASQSHTFTVTDAAGNTASGTVDHVNIDKSAPTLACGTADGTWHSSDLSIACTATENVSGLGDASDANFNLITSVPAGTETASAATGNHIVCDIAGNCATAGPIGGNKVDKKAPVITINAPTAGNYLLNQAVTVHFSCTDGGSGVASCTGTSANGGSLDTTSIGANTFTVNATDNVGNNAAAVSVNYTVGYGVVVLFDQTRAAKSGSTIPIKISLVDANGANISSPAISVHAVSVVQVSSQSSSVLQDAGNANPDYDFRYDAGLGGYIFNLKTTGFASGSYLLNFIAGGESSTYSVGFQVRQ